MSNVPPEGAHACPQLEGQVPLNLIFPQVTQLIKERRSSGCDFQKFLFAIPLGFFTFSWLHPHPAKCSRVSSPVPESSACSQVQAAALSCVIKVTFTAWFLLPGPGLGAACSPSGTFLSQTYTLSFPKALRLLP